MPLPAHAEDLLARAVLGPALGVLRGEIVTIETWSHALPWALALVREARRRGAEPVLVLEEEETFFRSLRLPRNRFVPRSSAALLAGSDAYVYLPGPEAFPRLYGLRERDLDSTVARHGPSWWLAAERHGVRVARLAIAMTTDTAAAHFGVDPEAWQRQVWRASLYPPGQLHRRGLRLARRLARARRVRVRHPNGTDFSAEVDRQGIVIEDGTVDPADARAGRLGTSIPSGTVALPLREGTAEGTWESNRRTYRRFLDPPATAGARWTFRGGRLADYSFDLGGATFAARYDRAGPGRDRPAVLTFGLNPAIGWAPELESIDARTISLGLGTGRRTPGRPGPPIWFASPLAGADVELDGVRAWTDGRTLPSARRRRTTPPRTGIARRTGEGVGPRARGAGERSARR